ncbi:hypothetical protein B0I35DRAFT_476601 [Stachybotrys elegans]|uniref:Uncharacterized protein n=1 Tax=Stachybotrys elegans TaxID=80388 RepID=A0A8K0SRI1_9HYPO|nr:hypothetical protein B0I35DRAFT_476601 [Stachybotrys elegans]
MAGCWNGFTAFNGSLSRDSLETPARDPNNPNLDTDHKCVQAAVTNFRAWLERVRQNPTGHGFSDNPINYASAASNLILEFFPPDGSRPRRFRTGLGAVGQRAVHPVMVPFADNEGGNRIRIADSISALGYLFSVVSVPAEYQPPTWDDYYFPLTVLYAWCAYLSYIHYAPTNILDIESVPAMTCAMCLIRSHDNPIFFLGSTKARSSINTAEAATDGQDNLVCLHYRASQIQHAAQICGGGPLPDIAALLRRAMIEGVFETLEGNGQYWPKVFTGLQFQGAPVASLYLLQEKLIEVMKFEYNAQATWDTRVNGQKNITPACRLENPLTAPQMEPAVAGLVGMHLAGGQPDQLQARWIKVLKLYMEPALPVPKTPAIPLFVVGGLATVPPGVEAAVQTLAQALYLAQRAVLNQKLANVVRLCRAIKDTALDATAVAAEQRQMNKLRKDVREDYGRCAETLPAYAVSAAFFPNRIVTAVDGPNIRGWAIETRKVGKCAVEFGVFDENFDKITLDFSSTVMNSSVYRLPCADYCQVMLKHVQHRATIEQQDAYNGDMRLVNPRTCPFPPA